MDRLVIEYPSAGATYGPKGDEPGKYSVYSYSVYGRGSVLEGQEKRSFRDEFETLEEAQAEYPDAKWNGGGSGYREVVIPQTPPEWFDPEIAGEVWDDSSEEIYGYDD